MEEPESEEATLLVVWSKRSLLLDTTIPSEHDQCTIVRAPAPNPWIPASSGKPHYHGRDTRPPWLHVEPGPMETAVMVAAGVHSSRRIVLENEGEWGGEISYAFLSKPSRDISPVRICF